MSLAPIVPTSPALIALAGLSVNVHPIGSIAMGHDAPIVGWSGRPLPRHPRAVARDEHVRRAARDAVARVSATYRRPVTVAPDAFPVGHPLAYGQDGADAAPFTG